MPNFVPITPQSFTGKKWRQPTSYASASKDALVSIVGGEIPKAATSLPLAFAKHGDRFFLVGLLGLTSGQNMFVTPDGRWITGYIPAALRGYPFRLIRVQGSDASAFCIDEQSGLVGHEGEEFFDAAGKLSPRLETVRQFLISTEQNRLATDRAVAAMAKAELFQPWPIVVKTAEGEKPVSGLYRVDERSLNSLADDAFLEVRRSGALPIAYAQLLSMSQLEVFERLARMQNQFAQTSANRIPDSLDGVFKMQASDDIVRFD